MNEFINFSENIFKYFNQYTEFFYFLIILTASAISLFIARRRLLPLIEIVVRRTETKWDDIFYEQKVFHRLVNLLPVAVIFMGAYLFPSWQIKIQKLILLYVTINLTLLTDRVLLAFMEIYNEYEFSRRKPIKSFVQVGQITVFFIGFLFILSITFDKSILVFMSGLGALTAVLMLVFKDSILSFKAGIQLIVNDLLRIGDWIEMPQFRADGDVIDISLDSVKVRNWDKTITCIPTFKLMEDSFKNWRGMQETGGRRISREIHLDQHYVRFLKKEDIDKLKEIDLIKDYLQEKESEIEEYNQNKKINKSVLANGRNLTNIGVFRVYIINYLRANPNISSNLTMLVRQLTPGSEGVPIQIYAFASDIRWEQYENIQSDIFDHIMAVIPYFDLRIYQKISQIKEPLIQAV